MKRCITFIMVFMLCVNNVVFADSENTAESEAIDYNVNYIIERMYSSKTIDCTPLDIRDYANMGFADDAAGDGKGGWTDQGSSNDMSAFNLFGQQKFLNIPFDIINPSQNDGKSCIILRGQNNEAFPLSAEIPVNDTAYGMYVLHSTAYGAGEKAGRYYFIYEDGTSAYFDIVGNLHIKDFWGTLNNNYTRVAWKGSNGSTSNITLNIFALNNPHPEKTIKSIKLESDGAVQYMNIVGITLAKELPIFPLMESTAASNMGIIKYGTDAWTKFKDPDESVAASSVLNMSAFLDAPAGNHGVLKAQGDKFVFEDGTEAKFWGTNIVGEACFPDNTVALEIVSRLSRSGYNLVRFVNFDEQELTEERLDKLAYFIKLLKDRGIYVYFSLLGNEKGDGADISDGWKIDGIFRDDLISKKSEFAGKLLKFHNKYTGMTIGSDPAVAMIDMADGNSMFDFEYGLSCLNVTDEESQKILTQKFNIFLRDKYKTTQKLKKVWGDVLPYESIEKGTVVINGNWKYGIFDDARKKDVIEFFSYLQESCYNIISEKISECGYRGVISGFTNKWNNISALNSISNSKTDFIPVNMMFSYGIDRTEKWPYLTKLKDNLIYVDTDSTVTSDGHDGKSLINLVKTRLSGKPFVVTEWGAANISRLYAENSFVMAAVAAQQGWTPIQYCFIQDEITKEKITDAYSVYSNPVTLGVSYSAAMLYYTMAELEDVKYVNQNISELYANKTNTPVLSEYLNSRTYTTVSKNPSDKKKASSDEFVIDNGGIYWDMLDGVFFAGTDKVIAFSGNTPKEESFDIVDFEIYATEAVLSLASLDDSKLSESEHMLLTLAGDVSNKGTSYTTKYVMGKIGDGGAVYNPISGKIVIKTKNNYDVYALNSDGTRKEQIDTEVTEDGFCSFLAYGAINYEIVRR